MKILVISDSHGCTERAFATHTHAEPVDMIIHLGDGSSDAELLREVLDVPVINVAGNCDHGSDAPRELVWECEGKRLFITHGDMYHVKSGLTKLLQQAEALGVDAALYGHTHRMLCETSHGVLLLNPGALSRHDSHRSYAVLTVTPESISALHYTIA